MKTIEYTIHKTNTMPLGASYTDTGIRFSTICNENEHCGVCLYFKGLDEPLRIAFPEEYRVGRVCSMEIKGILNCNYYSFYSDNGIYLDPYMKASLGQCQFGMNNNRFCVIDNNIFDFKFNRPNIPFNYSIFYMLHVRGFTAHNSSKIKHKGTFKGIIEKLNYLNKLGITSLILMPVYDFNETISDDGGLSLNSPLSMKASVDRSFLEPNEDVPDNIKDLGKFINTKNKDIDSKVLLNYWGYTNGYYYVPKSSYSSSEDANSEFCELVDKLHENNMEAILQFWFPDYFTNSQIVDILRFWSEKYNVDGFQLIGGSIPIEDILRDPCLYGCKILYDNYIYQDGKDINPNHGFVDSGFLYDTRGFLKGDPNKCEDVARRFRDADPNKHPVNAIARQDTMRLVDIVSYNEKHNIENGENGRDGADNNLSWNCGIEGATKKKIINKLRIKQIKNALSMVILSQGAPLIYAGDEFMNTQYGNNNPYNQDNDISYIKWSDSKASKEILDYTISLIKIKKDHTALCSDHLLSGRDQLSYGYPDVSLHGSSLWRPDLSPTSHTFGMLYYDKYFNEKDDRLIYIMFNMHWEESAIALPRLSEKKTFKIVLTSDEANTLDKEEQIILQPRSIVILETIE